MHSVLQYKYHQIIAHLFVFHSSKRIPIYTVCFLLECKVHCVMQCGFCESYSFAFLLAGLHVILE